MLRDYKTILGLLFFVTCQSHAQRSFFGMGLSGQFMFHGTTSQNYAIPDMLDYSASLVVKNQTSFALAYPSYNVTAGIEYRRFRLLFEPGFNFLNFPLKTYYPLSSTFTKYEKESGYTLFSTITFPLTVGYNLFPSYRHTTRWFVFTGPEYQYNVSKDNVYRVFYQKNYLYGIAGLGFQFQGDYRPLLSFRYHYLLNQNNRADMSVSYVSWHLGFLFPTDKMRRHIKFEEEK